MQKTLSLIPLLLAAITLNACVSSIKPAAKQQDFYDFGLQSSENQVNFGLPVESLTATDAIQHSNIRYRLNYKNPSQVFTYAESRWSTLPLDLMRQKIGATPSSTTACSLKLQIVAFDQVFDSATTSRSIVQLQASIVDRRSRKLVSSILVSAESAADSADAKGGVIALNNASTQALQQTEKWASDKSLAASECQLTSH